MRVVVADDEPDMQDYFGKILSHLGHQVVGVCANGKELLETCRNATPDLVITDLKMPEMNGDDALREIWAIHAIPAILISAYQCPEWIQQGKSLPPVRYLNKPINRAKLQSTLESFSDCELGKTVPTKKSEN
ncbi:response regulator [Blastopirellula marina]|uniref:Response regulator n=1 Tax=Blastopirellula marina TaxID=124 RepID=A0A2S8F6V4_9BACT|nr:response regulator [Blastopirellula marina]PQO27889.1 response regulator [Blastopirellula marina]PTL41625.1 response regulator [Blastopirellula marina]